MQLPPSRLSTVLNVLGTGVYHSSISLPISLSRRSASASTSPSTRASTSKSTPQTSIEYAFGGHASPGTTGIFAIPAGTAGERMSGITFFSQVELGQCFGDDWKKVFGPKGVRVRNSGLAGVGGEKEFGSTTHLNEASVSSSTLYEGESFEWEDDGGVSDGTDYMTFNERRVWRVIEAMKKEEEWDGTRYDLLGRNCNNFSNELAYRLTGKRIPHWINRAAWVATSVPCLIPEGWIDNEEEVDLELAGVTIAPPRADKVMEIPTERPGRSIE